MGTLLLYQAGVRGCSTEMDATADHPWNCIRNPAHVCLRHKPCPSLCFKTVIRGSFLITAEWCQEAAEIITGQEVTSNSHKISRSPLAKTVS